MSYRVVVAEDEAIIRLDIKEALQVQGYEVVAEAANGREAIDLIQTLKPDLAILDIKMPEIDGISVARAVSKICAVVILTAFSQKDLVKQAIDAGTQAYLVKPFELNELIAAIELAVVRFKETQALATETTELSERLEARKAIDKAKGILMDQLSLKESEAFSLIQKSAMDSRKSMKEISEEIISGKNTPAR